MKRFLSIVSAASLLLSGCERSSVEQEGRTGDLTVTAQFAEEETTRTCVNDGGTSVYWESGDAIMLFTPSASSKFTCDVESQSATTQFIGQITYPSVGQPIYGLYPYDGDADFIQLGNYTGIMTEIPSVQTARPGSFGQNMQISAAHSVYDGSGKANIFFYNVTGGICFKLSRSDIKKAVLKSLSGKKIAGSLKIMYVDDEDIPSSISVTSGSDAITLAAPSDACFEAGKWYYFVTAPLELTDGFQIRLSNDVEYADFKYQKTATVTRGVFGRLGTIDEGLEFTPFEDAFKISQTSFEVDPSGGEISFTVTSAIGYEVTNNASSWVSQKSVTEGTNKYSKVYTFSVSENTTDKARSGVIVVCNDNSVCIPVSIKQAASSQSVDKSWVEKEFAHKSLVLKQTATWCGWCPRMSRAIENAKEMLPSGLEVVNVHVFDSEYEFDQESILQNTFSTWGAPIGTVDGRRKISNSSADPEPTARQIVVYSQETVNLYGTTTGISFKSSFSGNVLSLKVTAYIKKAGDYRITALLTESGLVGYQADNDQGSSYEYKHDDIARIGFTSILGDKFTVSEDAQSEVFDYSATIPDGYVKDNLKVVVFISKAFGSSTRVSDYSKYNDYFNYYVDNLEVGKAGSDIQLAFKEESRSDNEGIGDGGEIDW